LLTIQRRSAATRRRSSGRAGVIDFDQNGWRETASPRLESPPAWSSATPDDGLPRHRVVPGHAQ
jgi:hypothetical protein